MSIVGNLRSVPDDDIDAVLASPQRVERRLYGETLGPAKAVRSDEKRAIAAELERLPPEMLAERFDPKPMMELGIYPEIWKRDPAEDDELGYLLEQYAELRAFVRRTADHGHGLIVYLN